MTAATITWRGLALAVVVTAVGGCARVPPADLSRDPAALLAQVRAEQQRIQTVRGSARVRIRSPGGSGALAEFVAAEKPDRLHLETLDFFGNPAAVLVAGGGRFSFLDRKENVLYRGEATPENVSRLLPVMVPIEELVTILCGSAPLLGGLPLEVGTDGGRVLLTIGSGPLGQRIAIGEHARIEWSRVRLSETGAGGVRHESSPAYDLDFDEFFTRAGVPFPAEIHLDAPAGRAHVDLAWHPDVEVNVALDAALFRLEPPSGVRVVEMEPGAPPPAFELPRDTDGE